MKGRRYYIIGTALLSVALGLISVWPESGFPAPASILLHSTIIFAAALIFLFLLPSFLGQPMQIFIAMITGILAGWLLAKTGREALVADYIGIFGQLFILLLKMVIVPLVFVSIVCGVAGIGDVRRLGSLGTKTLAYYFTTTGIAVLIGLACVNIIQPGAGRENLRLSLDAAQAQSATGGQNAGESLSPGAKIQQRILPQVAQNPMGAMAKGAILAVIFFALLLGAALAANNEKGLPALHFFQSMDGALITIVLWIMYLAPIGVFSLMAKAVATLGLGSIILLAKYCLTVLLGLGIHFIVLTVVLLSLFGRISPVRFFRGMAPALQLAFSTSSSSATLPVTLDCASRRVGVSRHVCSFMLPLGATINMDGTALYQAVASLFIAQVYGMNLTIEQQFMVFLTAVIVSVGSAGIPGASVGLMTIVLLSAGIPVQGVGIVIGVDRFLDMCRTLVNVTGDSVGAVVVGRSERALTKPEGPDDENAP